MPKRAPELTARQVADLAKPGARAGTYAVGVIPGLLLQVGEAEARSWVLRTLIAGRRRMIGLG